ncbi:MAG: 3-octaprenyl-4-hydroxybenzoate carboxy-lyase, partial [Planctomycetota bacterium]
VIIAATGAPIRELPNTIPAEMKLPEGFDNPRLAFAGALVIEAPRHSESHGKAEVQTFIDHFSGDSSFDAYPIICLVDDSEFATASLSNWLWLIFTRSNPAVDIRGLNEFQVDKHWGCRGPLVIDARVKHFHAPPLIEDPKTLSKVDARATRGDALAKYL